MRTRKDDINEELRIKLSTPTPTSAPATVLTVGTIHTPYCWKEVIVKLSCLSQDEADIVISGLGFNDREKLHQALKKFHIGENAQ